MYHHHQLLNIYVSKYDAVDDCDDDGCNVHDGGDDGENDNSGDEGRQEVSVTRCLLSLALCLAADAFKMDSADTWHVHSVLCPRPHLKVLII